MSRYDMRIDSPYDAAEIAAHEDDRRRALEDCADDYHLNPDDCGYELNDPKHPTYAERMADAADLGGDRDYDLGD